ncbi:MFS transporter [Capillimicrobium parvum]|uniref:MFS-type transporter YcaD n=1 Tax=Capillimicrobium parvum TaxID=2884022 RepID=A0A9E6XWE4_9ACTN|nr:MFS transporter [Capillimicrobium parvum]UGS35702.1 putative MFS-type transporter YcaD [Capillimicrobium parvum]
MRRLVLLVSAVVFVDTMFYAAVVPLLPHYADELGLSKAAAGLLSAAYPAGTLIGAIPAGLVVARVGARPTVLLGLGLLAGSSLVFGFANHVALLDAARFVQGIGGACTWAGGLAWLVEAAPPARRGALIGTALGAAIGGSLFGPVVGAIADLTKPEIVFSTVVVVAGALAAWAATTPAPPREEPQGLRDVGHALRRPALLGGMWLVVLPAAGFGAVTVLGSLRLDDLGAGGVAVGATFLVAAGVEAIISPIVGRVSDRRGRLVPIRVGLAIAPIPLCLFTVPRHAIVLAALIVATTAALGLFWAPAMALLSDAAEASGLRQGLAFGFVNLAWAAGMVVGSGGGGALAKATGDAVPPALVAAASVVTLAALLRRRQAESMRASSQTGGASPVREA